MDDASLFSKTILIVDDDVDWAQAASRIFQNANFTTEIVTNCTEAINYLNTTMPDCVLLDYYMPGQNGSALAAHIRGKEDLKGIPLVIVSGDETLGRSAHCDCKADYFLSKVQDITNMRYLVESLVRRVRWDRGINIHRDIRLNRADLTVRRNTGQVCTLTADQFRLFFMLVENTPIFVDETAIAKTVFKAGEDEDKSDAIRGLAQRLRKNLGPQLSARITYRKDAGWAYVAPRLDKRRDYFAKP